MKIEVLFVPNCPNHAVALDRLRAILPAERFQTHVREVLVRDADIQAILRHSNIGLTMNVYVKSVSESQTAALDSLSEKFGMCNDRATSATRRIQ